VENMVKLLVSSHKSTLKKADKLYDKFLDKYQPEFSFEIVNENSEQPHIKIFINTRKKDEKVMK
jgi:hypothetical protein